MNLLCVTPSGRGIQVGTVSTIRAVERGCAARGHGFDHVGIGEIGLEQARAELMAKARHAKPDLVFWLDDDCQISADDFFTKMLPLVSNERPMVMAPYRLKLDEVTFCVVPDGSVEKVRGIRTRKLVWGGLGLVLMQRRALDLVHEKCPRLQYQSKWGNGEACAAFKSEIVDGEYANDDRVFFARATKVGLSLWASVDVETIHDRRIGNYGQWLDAQVVSSEKAAE